MIIDHDIHVHTLLSDCCKDKKMTMENICKREQQLGIKTICFTDHVWDSDVEGTSEWYKPQDIAHSKLNLPLPKVSGMRILLGCETEFTGGTKVGLSKAHFDEYAFVLIPVNHFHKVPFVRPASVQTPGQAAQLLMERLGELIKMDLPFHKIGIPHLNTTLGFIDKQDEIVAALSEKRMRKIFKFFAEKGSGIELNAFGFLPGWQEKEYAQLWMFKIAKEEGCKFYFCSDGHDLSHLDYLPNLSEPADLLGLTHEDIYTIE